MKFSRKPGIILSVALLITGAAQAVVSTTFQPSSGFWNTEANWSVGLPGQTNSSVTATNDLAYVMDGDTAHLVNDAPVPLVAYDVWVGNAPQGGTLNVMADMTGLNSVRVGWDENSNGTWSQTEGAVDAVDLLIGDPFGNGSALFELLGGTFSTSGDVVVETTGTLILDDAVLTVGTDLTVNGTLELVLDERGFNSILTGGALAVGSNAGLVLDASGYFGGARTIELIGFSSLTGSFDTNNISFSGLRSGTSASISYDADRVNLILTEEPKTASMFWFSQKAWTGTSAATTDDLILNNGRALLDLHVPGLSCTQTNDGNNRVYSINWTGSDFNGDSTNDTLSFELRVEGFAGSTYTYSTNKFESSMTALGGSSDVTDINNTWGVGGDYDVDAGQSLRFSVTNAQVSVPGYSVDFEGFAGMVAMESNGGRDHLLILGEGTGLDGKEFDAASATYTLPSTDPFVVTGAGSFYTGSREWAVSSINYALRVYKPGQPAAEDLTDYSDYVIGPSMGDEYPAQTSFSNYPAFSWDTIPRWLIIRKGQAYTDPEVYSMATNYNLIVFEKANAAGFGSIEEGITDTATRIRAVDPETKNIFYLNTWIHYGGYAANDLYEPHAWEWSNHTIDTNGEEIIYMFKDRYYTHNYAVPEMRDWWVNTMLGMTSNSAIDGVFIDKVTHAIPSAYDEDGEPVSNYLTMLDALEQGLPEGKLFLGNTLRNERNYGGRAHMELQDGSYMERWHLPNKNSTPAQSDAEALAVSIQLMREAVAKGRIILFKTGSPDGYGSTQTHLQENVDYPLAIFLIVAETNAYFAYQGGVDATDPQWLWDLSWLPEFNRPLGAPQGAPVKDGFVYTRSYEHVDVWLNVETDDSILAWDNVDSDGDGIDDRWEYRNFGGTTNALSTANPDGDAYNNLEEYIAGLNPNVFDTFSVSNFTAGASNAFEWSVTSDRLYSVYWSSNLLDGFTLIQSNALNGSYVDTERADEAAGFYKITVELEP